MEQIKRFFKEENGTQVVETALVVSLISVVAIAALVTVGQGAKTVYENVADKVAAAAAP